jgi:hypothetical protein
MRDSGVVGASGHPAVCKATNDPRTRRLTGCRS